METRAEPAFGGRKKSREEHLVISFSQMHRDENIGIYRLIKVYDVILVSTDDI